MSGLVLFLGLNQSFYNIRGNKLAANGLLLFAEKAPMVVRAAGDKQAPGLAQGYQLPLQAEPMKGMNALYALNPRLQNIVQT